jgi:hypothetical protein
VGWFGLVLGETYEDHGCGFGGADFVGTTCVVLLCPNESKREIE